MVFSPKKSDFSLPLLWISPRTEEEGMADESQKLKRIAASSYDYESDSRWPDYWSNVLIPDQVASRPDVVDHFKRKFYQRYIDPELVVESMSTGGPSQSTRQSTPSSASSAPNSEPARQRNTGPTTRSSGPISASTGTPPPIYLGWDRQTIQFSINAWAFVVAVLAIFPFVP